MACVTLTKVDDMHVPLGRTLDNPSKDVNVGASLDIGGGMAEARERVGRHDLGGDPGPVRRGQMRKRIMCRNRRN